MFRLLYIFVSLSFIAHQGNALQCLKCKHSDVEPNSPCLEASGVPSVSCEHGQCFSLSTQDTKDKLSTFERGCLSDGYGSDFAYRCLGDPECIRFFKTCQEEDLCNIDTPTLRKACSDMEDKSAMCGPNGDPPPPPDYAESLCGDEKYCGKCPKSFNAEVVHINCGVDTPTKNCTLHTMSHIDGPEGRGSAQNTRETELCCLRCSSYRITVNSMFIAAIALIGVFIQRQ